MSTTLDQILSQRVLEQQQAHMAEVLDLQTWTPENRDERMAQARNLTEQIAIAGCEFVEHLLKEDLDGKPIMYWVLLNATIGGEIDLLKMMLDEYDGTTEAEISALPINAEWVSQQVRKRAYEMKDISDKVQALVSKKEDGTEEL